MLYSVTEYLEKYNPEWLPKAKTILMQCGTVVLVLHAVRLVGIGVKYVIAKRKYKQLKASQSWFPLWTSLGANGILKTLSEMRDEKNQGRFVKILNYGPSFSGDPIVILNDPETYKQLLEKHTTYPKPDSLGVGLKWLLGYGLVLLDGAEWHHRRKLLSPIFHFEALKLAVPKVGVVTNRFLCDVEKSAEKVYNSQDFIRLTLTAITNVLFEGDGLDTDELVKFYQSTVSSLSYYMRYRLLLGPLWNIAPCSSGIGMFAKMYQFHNMLMKVTTENMSKPVTQGKRRSVSDLSTQASDDDIDTNPYTNAKFVNMNLLQTLTAQPQLSKYNIVDELKTFLFAGHDTTANLISWTMYLLGTNKDKLAILHKELDEKLPRTDKSEPLTYENIQSLTYCRACLNETLRLRPPVPMIDRMLTEDIKVDGQNIEKGCMVRLFFFATQLDSEYWETPEKFMPERWMGASRPYTHPYAFMPFSAGPRNCIGQKFARLEATMVVAVILRRYTVEIIEPEKVTMLINGTMQPHNLKLMLSLRT